MKAEIVIPLLVAAIASVFFYTAVGQDFAREPAAPDGAPGASERARGDSDRG
jgi:hypothetical protein